MSFFYFFVAIKESGVISGKLGKIGCNIKLYKTSSEIQPILS
jgi:hypothetical protein